MRLLRVDEGEEFSLVEYAGKDVPSYAILSHTWGDDKEEISYADLKKGLFQDKEGFKKIDFCRKQSTRDGLKFYWIDTCCIDKTSSTELHEAINSMFQWYAKADKCYVFLSDVSAASLTWNKSPSRRATERALKASRWFTRGWTLQELLAPRSVEFFSVEGNRIGDRVSLLQQIHETTGISLQALQGAPLYTFSINTRLSWAERRVTKREEDQAYSLLGIFDVYMPLIYGEGRENAFRRLQAEIGRSSEDTLRRWGTIQLHRVQAGVFLNTEGHPRVPWVVPFPRPRSFVGRELQLARLSEHFALAGGQWLAIYGLGGCGKTALALEFLHQARERQPTCAIIWVPAVSRESFERAYQEIGTSLNIPGIADNKTDVKRLVKTKLSDERFGSWLMIVDNADDVSLLLDLPRQQENVDRLIDYLPNSGKGAVIFTTRTRMAAIKLAESNVMALGELDEAEAEEVLKKRLVPGLHHQLKDKGTVDEFLRMLAYLALAIVQAIAFVNTNDISLSNYIEFFTASRTEAMKLLSKEFEDRGRYRETNNAVATTWYISFEHIRKHNQLAARYLSFMACTDSNNIPVLMLPSEGSQIEHVEALGTLKAYAFISERQFLEARMREQQRNQTRQPAKAFDVHPLVHLATQGWLNAHQQLSFWTEQVLMRLVEIVPLGDHQTREIWTAYLPHATHVAKAARTYEIQGREFLSERIGYCEHTLGRYRAAECAHHETLRLRKKVLGDEHPDTLISMSNVAQALSRQGKYIEAGVMHGETLKLRKRVLGDEHPDTLTSMNYVARALGKQGNYAEAEKMHRETLALDKKVSGDEHPDTLTSMSNIAQALSRQGKYIEAEEMLRETLKLNKKVSGDEHPHTLTSMSNVAQALSGQGKYVEAEEMHCEELRLRKKVLGDEHPDTLTSMSNVAQALSGQGKYIEAEKIHRKTLKLRKKVSGDEHPHTLTSMSNVAQALNGQGKYVEAEEMHRETLVLDKKVSGDEHPDTLMSMSNVAQALSNQEKYTEAEKMHRETLKLRKKVLGDGHPYTLTSMSNVAQALNRQGKYVEAERIHCEELMLRKKVLGGEHPDTLMSMSNVAQALSGQGKYAEALAMNERAYVGFQSALGPDHQMTQACLEWSAHIRQSVASKPQAVNSIPQYTRPSSQGADIAVLITQLERWTLKE